MRAILLAARGLDSVQPSFLRQASSLARVIDCTLPWLLNGLAENGVTDVTIVGGKDIDQLSRAFPQVEFRFNPRWATEGMLASLYSAVDRLDGPCLVAYCDTVFRSEALRALLDAPDADFTLAVDRAWRPKYADRPAGLRAKVEVVGLQRDGTVREIRKGLESAGATDAEFAGLLRVSMQGAHLLRGQYDAPSATSESHLTLLKRDRADIVQLLQALVEDGHTIRTVDVAGLWTDLDVPQDLARFVFGTKAQTLERLRPLLRRGRILHQVAFTTDEWLDARDGVCRVVQETFSDELLVVRSSALDEDLLEASRAGAYRSVLNVPRSDTARLAQAVDTVIASFDGGNGGHQVLVQPQVRNVRLSGVAFTCDIRSGAPYYIINYDRSDRTDGVTSGASVDQQAVAIWKGFQASTGDSELDQVIGLLRELEVLTGSETIDVEFALTHSGELLVFQARPLAITEAISRYYLTDLSPCFEANRAFVARRLARRPPLPGHRTVLGDMPDWNPAEMIGPHPRPLAYTLYTHIITERVWRLARAALGYANPESEQLMVIVGGHPYIDVRNSLINLSPAVLPEGCLDRLVSAYVEQLVASPDAHDKLEFEVAITCLTPDFERHAARLRHAGIDEGDIDELREGLRALTDALLLGQEPSVRTLLARVDELERRRPHHLALGSAGDHLLAMSRLLADCSTYGTLPFSVLARMAFVATTLLRSLVSEGVLTQERLLGFLQRVPTVAGELTRDLDAVYRGELDREVFLQRYGHLRPGTYDIRVPRYDEAPDAYFPGVGAGPTSGTAAGRATGAAPDPAAYFSAAEYAAMDSALLGSGLTATARQLVDFASAAIPARELAKFCFTANLSAALQQITRWGEQHGLAPDDLSFLSVETLRRLSLEPEPPYVVDVLRAEIENARRTYQVQQQLILPHLIASTRDLEVVCRETSRPNFITTGRVSAETAVLSDGERIPDLQGKLALISSADPGYDWIFTRGIAGLITMYGGVASHMAIRCAEFGLPAAIGCGARLFDELAGTRRALLDCENHSVRPI